MRRSFTAIALLLLVIASFLPIIGPSGGEGSSAGGQPPSRYGFTPVLYSISTPTTDALSVDTANFDGANNDDIVIGLNGAVQVFRNNGGSGPSFGMTLMQTISLSGFYITKVKAADYDNDGDQDIIALGQEVYLMAGDLGTGGPSIGKVRVYYIENVLNSFSVETYLEKTDGYQFQRIFYWSDAVYDISAGDVDRDNDMDTVLFYYADSDGNSGNGGEQVKMLLLRYSSGTISETSLLTLSFPVMLEFNVQVQIVDLDEDGYQDIVYSMGGIYNNGNNLAAAQAYVMWHTGTGANWGTPVNLDPNSKLVQSGGLSMTFALVVGNFAGASMLDVAVATNLNGGTSPPFGDTGISVIKQKAGRTFDDPYTGYSDIGHFMIRGLDVGNLDNVDGDDFVGFTKLDANPDPSSYDAITDYTLCLLSSRIQIPYMVNALKVYLTRDTMPFQVIKGVAMGNFDNDADGYDDIVYVGSKVTVGLTTFPPNNPPSKVRVSVSPSPVLNKDNKANINITMEDLDGSWDLAKVTVDFTEIGLGFIAINKPTSLDPLNDTVGYYEFDMVVPETVRQGDYQINLTFYDMSSPRANPKSTDSFIFRVKQYNREPVIVQDNRTLFLDEDITTYYEGIYSWFEDLDIIDGYAPDLLNISLKNSQSNQWLTFSDNEMYRVELVNGSSATPQDWSLKIIPKSNKFHKGLPGESDKVTLRAVDPMDTKVFSEELVLTVKILSVNDPPLIPLQGKPEKDFSWALKQDDFGTSALLATDAADEDPGGSMLRFFFEYDNEDDSKWLICEPDGKLIWRPTNAQVGDHKVTLWVADTGANVSHVLYFNVSNVIDPPVIKRISNGTHTFNNPDQVQRYEFIVFEHEEFNLTIEVSDPDYDIDLQQKVAFQCDLTLLNNTYLDVDKANPLKAYLHFWAEKKFGYLATYGDLYPPIDTEIRIVDEMDQDTYTKLLIRIVIVNVNDPPVFISIDKPVEGFSSPILYNIQYSAGEVIDPDTVYNDTIEYQWDFDASNGFQVEATGLSGIWNFERAGRYTITLRGVDGYGNYLEATTNITVAGKKDDKDFDNDGLPNDWEDSNGFNKLDPSDAALDSDGDELSNYEEYLNQTDPKDRDSDDDSYPDGEDFAPLNPAVWIKPVKKEKWSDNPINLILIILLIIVVIALLIALMFYLIARNRKKAREEEEKRKLAEEMQKSMYEGQDLYSNLPKVEEAPQVAPMPAQPQLPPMPEAGLDDIFGGAGKLPQQQLSPAVAPPVQQQGLPPAPAPPSPEPQTQPGKPGDLTDLLG